MLKCYKGKRKDGGGWICGSLIDEWGKDPMISFDFHNYPVIPESIVEYTGVNDADSNMVFDGDILQFGAYKVAVFWNGEQLQWQARKHKMFWCKCPEKDWDYIELGMIAAEPIITGQMTTKVIGNVFDNPDFYREEKSEEYYSWEF